MIFHFDKVEMVSLPLSVKIRSKHQSHQIFGVSEVSFSVISVVYFIAGVANMEAHQLPALCTFSSTVLAPSWVLLLPEL